MFYDAKNMHFGAFYDAKNIKFCIFAVVIQGFASWKSIINEK